MSSKKEATTAAKAPNKKAQREAAKAAKAQAATQSTPAAKSETTSTESAPQSKAAKAVKEGGLPPLPKLPKSGNGSRERKVKPIVDCTCGCGGKTTGAWVPGHDARARGWAIRIERDVIKMSDVPENERPGAKFMLADRKKKGLTGKGVSHVKSDPTPEADQPKSEIDLQVDAAIADGMSLEAAAGLRESLEAAAQSAV